MSSLRVFCRTLTRTLPSLVFTLVLIGASAGPALALPSADEEVWQSYPLYGAEITALVVHPTQPQTLFVGTGHAGVFKSVNGGELWTPARAGLSNHPIITLVIDPAAPDTLFAGTEEDGIWKSTDGGASWVKSSTGLDDTMTVFQILFDPSNHNTLYAGLGGTTSQGIGVVFKSTDGGAHWLPKDTGIPAGDYENYVHAMAIHPTQATTVYAGTAARGVFKTTNGGTSWTAVNDGLPLQSGSTERYRNVSALAFDPHHEQRLVAVVQGEYYTLGTEGWTKISTSPWAVGSSFDRSLLLFPPDKTGTVYSVSDSLNVSVNGGVDWERLLGWADSGHVVAAGFHPSQSDHIYAGTQSLYNFLGGVYRSDDAGDSWEIKSSGLLGLAVTSVAGDSHSPQSIFVGVDESHLHHSTDAGLTWTDKHLEGMFRIDEIAVNPADAAMIYAVGGGMWRSKDGGQTYAHLETVAADTIALTPGALGPVYTGGVFGDGIYKSDEHAENFTPKTEGLPVSGEYLQTISCLALDPLHPQTVWALFQNAGVYQSTDSGETWHARGLTETNTLDTLAVNPVNTQEILVGGDAWEGQIFKSRNSGQTWDVKTKAFSRVYDIVYDPRNPLWVYAATEEDGVLRSTNGGETWSAYTSGIFYPDIRSLAWTGTAENPVLVAGSMGAGVYYIQPAEITVVETLLYIPIVKRQ